MKKYMTMAMAAVMAASVSTAAMAADTKTAAASNAGVLVNGVEIAPEAYTIDGYTFFKLRDVAAAVAGTEAGFDVAWDAEAKKIALTTGVSYEAAAEAGKKAEGSKAAALSEAPVLVDGEETTLTAYTIDGYTYFKLRDLGTAAGFEVTWDAEAKMIGIHAPAVGKDAEEAAEEEIVEEDVIEEAVAEEETAADEEDASEGFMYVLEADQIYEWEGETFVKDVILSCAPTADSESLYEAVFNDCVFEGDVFLVADGQAEVKIGEGCTFAEGKGVVVLEYTAGSHLTGGSEGLCSVMAEADGIHITAETAVSVFASLGGSFMLNGTEYSKDSFGNTYGVEAVFDHLLKYYYENDTVGYVMTHEATAADAEGNIFKAYAGD